MNKQRDLEAEREMLLRRIEAALSETVRDYVLHATWQLPLQPRPMMSTNEKGSDYAD
ncbi:MAG: hypothetical protein ABFC65_06095 [Rectinema sp.]